MIITYATIDDFSFLDLIDNHISEKELIKSIKDKKIYLMYDGSVFVGILRYNYFWDNTPFLNFIYVNEKYRSTGCGTKMLKFWEDEMKQKGFAYVLSSSQSNELGQHFFRKNGYKDCGGLILPSEPLEIIFVKEV